MYWAAVEYEPRESRPRPQTGGWGREGGRGAQTERVGARNCPATHDVITPCAAMGLTHSMLVRVLLGVRRNPHGSLRGHLVDVHGNALQRNVEENHTLKHSKRLTNPYKLLPAPSSKIRLHLAPRLLISFPFVDSAFGLPVLAFPRRPSAGKGFAAAPSSCGPSRARARVQARLGSWSLVRGFPRGPGLGSRSRPRPRAP